jgi:GNAT superfamily N-acetyltransferase
MIKLKNILKEIEEEDDMEFMYHLKAFELRLKDEFPQINSLSLVLRPGGDIHIVSIVIRKSERRKGIGREVIKRILKFADDYDKHVTLHMVPQPRYKAKLNKLYRNLGFRPNRGRHMIPQYSNPFHGIMMRKPGDKTRIEEGVARLEKGDTILTIPTEKGDYRVRVFKFKRGGITKYNFDINSPPDHYENYGGKPMAVGGTCHLGTSGTNIEQVYAELAATLKKLGLPYVQSLKLKIIDTETPEKQAMLDKLEDVIVAFQQEMEKPENQPKQFGMGPPDYSQWISGEDVKYGRLQKTIENYGDFFIVIKWAQSPRDVMKASDFLKHYEHIIAGKEAKGDYAREVFIRSDPFKGI